MASEAVLAVTITSNINSFETIRRFPKEITVAEFKQKIEPLTGASAAAMELQLLSKNKEVQSCSFDDNALLSSYSADDDGLYIHVIDPTHKAGEFEDLSSAPKFELSDAAYEKRQDTFRAFREKNKIGGTGGGDEKNMGEKELFEKFNVGDRCEVVIPNQPKRRGTIMYLGSTEFKPGNWVGVKYDKPVGKNDGNVQGKCYFNCAPKHGSFVKPHDVVIGDFPVVDDEI